jgi:uncharacterized membrane-anchored protein YhcB (DUF1043 family)
MHTFITGLSAVGAILGALVSIGIFVHFVVIRPMRHFLRNEIVNELVGIREGLAAQQEQLQAHIGNGARHGAWGF